MKTISQQFQNLLPRKDFFIASNRVERYLRHPIKSLNIFIRTRLYRIFKTKTIKVATRTFWGDSMWVLLPDGAPIYLWGLIDGEEVNLTRYLIQNLRVGDRFFDIGAHFGFYSLLASNLVGRNGLVYSFEPTPRTFDILSKNTIPRSNVFVENKAVWSKNGHIFLTDFGPEGAAFNTTLPVSEYPNREITSLYRGTLKPVEVETIALDDFCSSIGVFPDFMKVDAEGAEMEILIGAKKVLEKGPSLSIEIWQGEGGLEEFRKIEKFLRNYSYIPYAIEKGGLRTWKDEVLPTYGNVIFQKLR